MKNETDSTIDCGVVHWVLSHFLLSYFLHINIFFLFAVYQILSIRRSRIDDTQEERNKIDYIQSRKFSFVNLILFANWTNIILFEQVRIMYSFRISIFINMWARQTCGNLLHSHTFTFYFIILCSLLSSVIRFIVSSIFCSFFSHFSFDWLHECLDSPVWVNCAAESMTCKYGHQQMILV